MLKRVIGSFQAASQWNSPPNVGKLCRQFIHKAEIARVIPERHWHRGREPLLQTHSASAHPIWSMVGLHELICNS